MINAKDIRHNKNEVNKIINSQEARMGDFEKIFPSTP